MIQLIKENKYFYLLSLFVFLIGGIYLLNHTIGQFSLLLNNYHSAFANYFFRYITWLGDGFTIMIICIFLLFVKFRYAFIASVVSFLSALIISILKNIFNYPRPAEFFKDEHLNFVDGVELYHWLSFPSGHTAAAFALFCVLGFFAKKKIWSILFFVLALLVAFSRVYLFQHFLQDVYFGALIGIINATILYYLFSNASFIKNRNWGERSLLRLKLPKAV